MTCACKTQKPKRGLIGAIVAAIVLVLLPKCPMCFIGYAAVLGIGLSAAAAAMLREALLFACVAVIVTVTVRLVARRAFHPKRR